MIIDPGFLDHWKVRAIAGLLGRDEKAPLYMIRLWAYCQTSKKTSIPNNSDMLATLCCFKGNGDVLMNAFIECNVLDRNEDGTLEVHDFAEWNRSLISLRKNAEEAREALRLKRSGKNLPKVSTKTLPKDSTKDSPKEGLDRIGINTPQTPLWGACECEWISKFLEALVATGKMPSVTVEIIKIVNRDHPKADLEHRWPEIVLEVQGLAGPAQNTVQVLRRAASRLETRVTAAGSQDAEPSSEPDYPEWLKEELARKKRGTE